MAPRTLGATLAAACLAAALPATGTPATGSATGKICGAAGRCLTLPRPLAIELSKRNGGFDSLATPRRAPYYRIEIKATGEGYISKTILWVPSAHVWFLKEHTRWPDAGYWRTDDKTTRAALTRVVRRLSPLPARRRWAPP